MKTRNVLEDYCNSTTIHGFAFFVKAGLNWLERIFWACILILFFSIGVYLILGSFDTWDEKPVLTTIDQVVYPLSKERFPTVTICPNQQKETFNEWRFVETSLLMIEDECQNSDSKYEMCAKYVEEMGKVRQLAELHLQGSSWRNLTLASIAQMLDFVLKKNKQSSLELQKSLIILSNDPSGKLSPLLIPWLIMATESSSDIVSHSATRLIYNEICNQASMTEYAKNAKKWFRGRPDVEINPCLLKEDVRSPCCGHIGEMIMENIAYVSLVMKYSVPNFFVSHRQLAKHLGLDSDKHYNYPGNNLIPHCYLPESGLSASANIRN